MRGLKKISLVYILQIFAVLLIFAYPRPSSETKEAITDKISPPAIKNKPVGKTDRDLLLTGKINDLPIIYIGKSW